jgi:hypothetical protein
LELSEPMVPLVDVPLVDVPFVDVPLVVVQLTVVTLLVGDSLGAKEGAVVPVVGPNVPVVGAAVAIVGTAVGVSEVAFMDSNRATNLVAGAKVGLPKSECQEKNEGVGSGVSAL